MIRLEVKNCSTILTEKQQKYQDYHLEKLISLNTLQVTKYYLLIKEERKQSKFTYSPLGKAFENQTKTIEEQGKKQVDALKALTKEELESVEGLFPNNMINDEIKNEVDGTKKWEDKIKQKYLKYDTSKYKYNFQRYETIINS